jgi:hypothetical protein
MTTHRTLPSEVEPEALRELIEDCRSLPPAALPRPRTIDVDALAAEPYPARVVPISQRTAELMADLDEYV